MSFFDDDEPISAELPTSRQREKERRQAERIRAVNGIPSDNAPKNKMTDEQINELFHAVGVLVGQVLSYKLLRKLGAPKWAAYLGAAHLANQARERGA